MSISTPTTINAIAVASGYADSPVASATYTMTAASPTFSPVAGTYNTPTVTVSLADSTPGAAIYYTTNSSTPTTSSSKYSAPLSISATTTIQAIAVASGYANSSVASATYTITIPAASPTFSPVAGTYNVFFSLTITLSDSTPGAVIYYTTNGSTPTTSSSKYSAPLHISTTTTIRAIAVASGYANSPVTSANYTIRRFF